VPEVNPRHPLIIKLAARAGAGGDLAEAAGTLLDLARSGFCVRAALVEPGCARKRQVYFARAVWNAATGAGP
jgi:molecular chaperone HtpG